MSDWCSFLHNLGRFVSSHNSSSGLRGSAVISLPCLDFASVIISSGIIATLFEDKISVLHSPKKWNKSQGVAVCFPRVKHIGGDQNLYVSKGVITGIDTYKGREHLLVRWVENNSKEFDRAVENRWLPLVIEIDDTPSLERIKPGSILARHVQSLEAILGESGLCRLVQASHNAVCLLDTKNRVIDEVKERLPLSKFGLAQESLNLVLRDLVRLDLEGGEAMSETYCCRVLSEPEDECPATVISGSLRFLKHWDNCDSPIRVAILSPTETNYMDAVSFANELYSQRAREEFKLPDELLRAKPASIDIQLMYSQ